MRKEATLEQWRTLYEMATRIKELKPWEMLWNMDIIGIQYGEEKENTVYFSILGRSGDCYGIVVYEDYEGFNGFWLLPAQTKMGLSTEYMMYCQKNLTCYWGDRKEVPEEQRKIIEELGYSYHGKNQWLYFLSFVPGYAPYNMDEEEVLRMTEYLQDLELALRAYEENGQSIDFVGGNMFLFKFSEDKENWSCGEAPLPFTKYYFNSPEITDEQLYNDLAAVPKEDAILETDIVMIGDCVDKEGEYERPANHACAVLVETTSGTLVDCNIAEPEDDPLRRLAESIIGYCFEYGAPKEIRVSNAILEIGLKQICEVCGAKLCRVKRLSGVDKVVKKIERLGV